MSLKFSFKPKTHINTICNLLVIAPHGARKKPLLMQELASKPPSSSPPAVNSYAMPRKRYASAPITYLCAATAPHLTMLTLLQCPLDVLLPSSTTSLPSPIYTLLHPCLSKCLCFHSALYICLLPCHPILELLNPQHLPSLCLCSAL
ncbi:hypothetical protein O181_076116 [Austropuccinia psidii MF-1]|uniref:Uncharacterized protein n=1 Tax=Austropuccinia psidii MF-1 TaxID=1389203 RepID=A0A9Q3F9S1_9BASI|nr:hypothetical protein [Austropuccinia psidii MF-1]